MLEMPGAAWAYEALGGAVAIISGKTKEQRDFGVRRCDREV